NNGVAVTAGQFVSAADITRSEERRVGEANGNGSGYASFNFQVQDDGGTAHSGVDLDQSANTLTIDVTSVNDAPAGTNNTVSVLEDGSYTFAAADFGFTDPTDAASAAGANALLAVEITTLPGAGSLTNNGVAVTAGQFVSAADITAGKLKFSPAANANGAGYASFTFQVQDDGGTAHSGVELDDHCRADAERQRLAALCASGELQRLGDGAERQPDRERALDHQRGADQPDRRDRRGDAHLRRDGSTLGDDHRGQRRPDGRGQ